MADFSGLLQSLDSFLIGAIIIMMISAFFITNMLFRPLWYAYEKNKLVDRPPLLDDRWKINSRRNGLGDPETDLGLEFEHVEFHCGPKFLPGNRILRGWLIPSPNKDKELCVVVCHGGGRDRRQHLRHVPHLRECGAAVLLFDKQEHGLSDGNTRGIGWFTYEGSDVYAACKFIKLEQQYEKVVAMGASFGGVGVITAAGHFDEIGDEKIIDGVIAENPPHSRLRFVRDLIHLYGSSYRVPSFISEFLTYITICIIPLRRGFSFVPNPIDVIANISPRPLLITHGEEDTVVPFEHGVDLYNAALEPKSCLWVPKCDHCMIFDVDPKGWKIKTADLLSQLIENKQK